MTNYYFDVDGVLADFHSEYDPTNRAASLTYKFIRNLKPFAENIKAVKALVAAGEQVFISTMVANENTRKARVEWLAEYLPEIPAEQVITIMGHGNKAVKALVAAGEQVFISTMVANENTRKARIEWLAEYLPEIPAERVITIMGHGNKADHMMTEDGILVDDKKANCRQWEKAGHKAVWLEVKGGRIEL